MLFSIRNNLVQAGCLDSDPVVCPIDPMRVLDVGADVFFNDALTYEVGPGKPTQVQLGLIGKHQLRGPHAKVRDSINAQVGVESILDHFLLGQAELSCLRPRLSIFYVSSGAAFR